MNGVTIQEILQRVAAEAALVKEGDLKAIGRMVALIEEGGGTQGRFSPLFEILGRLVMADGEDAFQPPYQQLLAEIARLQAAETDASSFMDESVTPTPEPILAAPVEAPQTKFTPPESISAGNLQDTAPEGSMDFDRDLLLEFADEAIGHLQSIELDLLALESDPDSRAIVDRIFRPFHTIKGVAGFLSLKPIHQVCHNLENMMDDARKGQLHISGTVADVVLEGVDLIKQMILPLQETDNPEKELSRFQGTAETFVNKVIQVHQGARHAPGESPTVSTETATVSAPAVPPPAPARAEAPSNPLPKDSAPSNPAPSHPAPNASVPKAVAPVPAPSMAPPPARQAGLEEDAMPSSGSSETIRVKTNLLNQLMDLAGELVLGRNQLMQKVSALGADGHSLSSVVQHLDRVTSEMQEAVMQTRMQPIGGLFSRYHRVVRDLARNLGKDIHLNVSGEGVELDKSLIEAMMDPLTHLIRNASDHGVEAPSVRTAAGKPAQGTITLAAYQEGGKVRVKVADDGGGINAERVRQKAVEKGLITPEQAHRMSEKEIFHLIFEPGFSTADQVTGVSGRGVGMDVVRMNVEKIGGVIEVLSQPGQGTTFHLDLPLTLAIVPALIVMTSGERFAIPQINLLELVHLEGEEAVDSIMRVRDSEVFRLRGAMLPLLRLGNALGLNKHSISGESTSVYIVVLAAGKTQFGLMVDAIYDTEEIVVKPLGNLLTHLNVFAGATLMGDGRPALILDVAGLARGADMIMEDDQHMTTQESRENQRAETMDEQAVLLFNVHPDERFAVPLPLVSRLEEVHMSSIRSAIKGKVMEYRGKLLPLVFLEDMVPIQKPLANRETAMVLVFEIERNVGLVVTRIIDSIEMAVQLDSKSLTMQGFNGIALVQGHPTAFVDIYQVVEMAYPDWFKQDKDARRAKLAPQNRTILLAEDSSFYRTVERNYLTQEGFRVIDVENGRLALDYLLNNQGQIDCLVTDIEMPHMDGFELTRRVRASQELAGIPIIALTSLAQEEDKQRGLEAGVNAYLVKLHREELLREVNRLLVHRGS
ncbi:MAG: chemotaxis protein CheW [Deltaproteobacteria bacterium]|nr:chemotaxis protein CheW [Deltaproteobacteria bacterium]